MRLLLYKIGNSSRTNNYFNLNSLQKLKNTQLTEEQTLEIIIDSIQDIKGVNIVKLDLRKLDDAPCSYFVICDGNSNTQVKAIADNILKRMKEEANALPSHREGLQNALWVCLDYFDIVIHVFYKETREFYQLEHLWSDADITTYETI